tara:strand:+ start:128 stop:376 length:249 start_codon:yes stop_codon:yes gene_type:complete
MKISELGEEMRFGYVIERSGVTWGKRFWMDMPAFKVRGFGDDDRARVFITQELAQKEASEISREFGCHCYVTKLSDLYPSFV